MCNALSEAGHDCVGHLRPPRPSVAIALEQLQRWVKIHFQLVKVNKVGSKSVDWIEKKMFTLKRLMFAVNERKSLQCEYPLSQVPRPEELYEKHSPRAAYVKNDVTFIDSLIPSSRQLFLL